MELIDVTTDVPAFTTSVTTGIADNMPGILALLAVAVGLTVSFRLLKFIVRKISKPV